MRSKVYETVGRPSVRLPVCLSVRPIMRPSHAAATGLLLWARRAGDIDHLLHNRRSAAAAPQQQMRAVPRCQLTSEAEHRLVIFMLNEVEPLRSMKNAADK